MMDEHFFSRDAVIVAADLLGACLLVNDVGGYVVETEAYRHDDEASHSFRGRTNSNAVMFGGPGRAYVYRSYGLHWCLNIVCEHGSAVLIRSLEPALGVESMMARRSLAGVQRLCAGPGNLCKALAITGEMNGLSVVYRPFSLELPPETPIWISGPRVGISKATSRQWRFAVKGSSYLSKPI